ncbi:TolC family protein, partial [Candidatus Magnetaquicoccus inordinatus]|uniref:TolC family protein n=1 Tax=Candidatus Magnetaquicoccus inordinatus TaxID=2496818 RepID=UPI001D0E03E2
TVDIEKAGHYPMLDMQATALTYHGGSDTRIDGSNQYSVSVQLTVPLFSGGKVFSRTREALEMKNAREADWQKVDKQALREIKQAHLMMNSAKATVSSSEAAYSFYKQAVKGMEEEFAAGFRTVIQLLELQNQLFRSETDLVKTRYELISSQYQLLQTIGQLTPERLALPEWQEPLTKAGAEAAPSTVLDRLLQSLQEFSPLAGEEQVARNSTLENKDRQVGRPSTVTPLLLQRSERLHSALKEETTRSSLDEEGILLVPGAEVNLRASKRLQFH